MAHTSIYELLREVSSKNPDEVAYRHKRDGRWLDVAWGAHEAACREIARALLALGARKGDRIAILSQTRLEWVQCDFGIAGCGGVTVGIYPSSLGPDCGYVLEHSDSSIVFVEDGDQLAKLAPVRAELPNLRHIVRFDGPGDPKDGVLSWEEFLGKASAAPPAAFEERVQGIRADDLASFVYTSGTTGVPKGAMITHGNLLFASRSAGEALPLEPGQVTLLILPLSHVFARLTIHLCMRRAVSVAFAESIQKVAENLKEVRPDFMAGVPRIYEKLQDRILSGVREAGWARRKLFGWALAVGKRASRLEQHGRPIPTGLRLERALARALVFRRIHEALGGRIRFLISGAAPLDRTTAEFFHACGILILEGMGMTENTSFSNVNRREGFKFGSVGPVGPGIEMKVAPDGEILFRGPNVMKGYFKDAEATVEAIDREGWLHTGDIGEIDEEGFLEVTDRKKDLIVTAGGKKVAPQRVEGILKRCRFISQAVAFGDRRKYITALVALDPVQIAAWAQEHGKNGRSPEELARDPELQALIDAEVGALNGQLASFESVKKVRIVPREFSIEGGELTPTLKIRRKVVAETYRPLLEEMYRE